MVIFIDAAVDSRVFALAHERLALWQGALWGWGGTLGVPGLDFYLVPEVLWGRARCHSLDGRSLQPQELFMEQVSVGLLMLWLMVRACATCMRL